MTDSKKHITATEYGRANLPWVVFKDDKRIEYLYDAADQCIGRHIGDDRAATLSEEYYIRAGGLELAVYDYTQDEMTWYLHGSEREAKATTPAPADFIDDSRTAQPGLPALRWSFYLSDHLGNTRMVFSASCESHAVVYNYEFVADYTPYGRILRSTGHEKYQTTQHERDAETDLDYRGARFYDSDAGRFLSLDPMAAKYLALGAYVYVAGNPVRFVDPDGREIVLDISRNKGESDDAYDIRKRAYLAKLQSLTNDVLSLNGNKVVIARMASENIDMLSKCAGTELIRNLVNGVTMDDGSIRNFTVTIVSSTLNGTDPVDNTVKVTDESVANSMNGIGTGSLVRFDISDAGGFSTNFDGTNGYSVKKNQVGLAHELFHAENNMRGINLRDTPTNSPDPDAQNGVTRMISREELNVRQKENQIRREQQVKPRLINPGQ